MCKTRQTIRFKLYYAVFYWFVNKIPISLNACRLQVFIVYIHYKTLNYQEQPLALFWCLFYCNCMLLARNCCYYLSFIFFAQHFAANNITNKKPHPTQSDVAFKYKQVTTTSAW